MNVLVVTGDKSFKSGHPRFELQASAVNTFEVLYWGPGALWPEAPRGEFDVVSTQDPFYRGLVGMWVAKKLNAKLNVQVHADMKAQSFLKRLIARFVLKKADSIRVVSEKIKRQVEGGSVTAPITVLPIFLDIARFKNSERESNSEPTVLWIGRFEDEKDPLLAVQVFKEVHTSLPEANKAMLGDGSLKAKAQDAAKGLPVTFPGWQNDILPYLSKSHAVLSTSRAESWGASIIEALAAGVPVVAPDVGAAKEAGALVVSKGELAQTLIQILREKRKGELTLQVFTQEEWLTLWQNSLV